MKIINDNNNNNCDKIEVLEIKLVTTIISSSKDLTRSISLTQMFTFSAYAYAIIEYIK